MLILASQSPRRKELLERAGIACTVRPSHVPEVRRPAEDAWQYARRLACSKARAVETAPGDIVLGADTVVLAGDQVLEKPESAEDAARMLRILSGRRHTVITGICLLGGGKEVVDAETTLVDFAPLSEGEIGEYVRSGEPFDKAGAYAIQGLASKFILRVEGCYPNVVGLPIALVYKRLQEMEAAAST